MDDPTTTVNEPAPIPSDRSEGTGPLFYPLCFMIVIALYVLSPGPICKVLHLGGDDYCPKAYVIAFAPLSFCYEHFPLYTRFCDWYMTEVWRLP